MTKWKIYNQDVIEWSKSYEKGKFHALISDTPYHLTSIVKRFGKINSKTGGAVVNRINQGIDGYARYAKGFMGQEWDGGDIAFRPETWEALGEHLYPGAFGMCFSASRNWHRLAVAIEDAGMIIHPTIFGWLNGQGFPKATNISKQIQPASEMKVVGSRKKLESYGKGNSIYGGGPDHSGVLEYLEPTNEIALRWNGHRYGLQALKPAVEPIIVFQKPYEGKPIESITRTGAGAINIDGGRIPVDAPVTINRFTNGAKPWGDAKGEEFDTVLTSQGRWPANFILSESVAPSLDEQSGITSSKMKINDHDEYHDGVHQGYHRKNKSSMTHKISGQIRAYDGEGGASRFFYNVSEQIDEADPIYYCGKVSPKERNAGLDDAPEVFGGSLDGGNDTRNGKNKMQLHPTRNPHPTLKPIALAKYLATLLLPPEEYGPRRILIPFSGVSSEMIGAALAGWEHVVGIEFMEEYVELGKKRLEHWIK